MDRNPEIGDPAADPPAERHRAIEPRRACDHRVRVAARGLEEGRYGREVVLAVGIDLEGVAVALGRERPHAAQHGCPLALVVRVAQAPDPGSGIDQAIDRARLFGSTAVVDDQDRQRQRRHLPQQLGQGAHVIVRRHQDARPKRAHPSFGR